METGLISRVAEWYKKPFSADMSASGWFLFAGLVMVAMLAWNLILHTFKE